MYNQLERKDTNYACSIYAFLNAIKYDYGVYVDIGIILKTLIYLEKIGAFFRWEGAYAKVIFPALIRYINFKLKIKLKIKTISIKDINNKHSYILGYKRANTTYIKLSKDGEITEQDILKLSNIKKVSGHFHMWKKGKVLESLGGYFYKMPIKVLKLAFSKDLYYSNIRFIYGEEKLRQKLINIVKAKKKVGLYKIMKDGSKNYYISIKEFIDIKK